MVALASLGVLVAGATLARVDPTVTGPVFHDTSGSGSATHKLSWPHPDLLQNHWSDIGEGGCIGNGGVLGNYVCQSGTAIASLEQCEAFCANWNGCGGVTYGTLWICCCCSLSLSTNCSASHLIVLCGVLSCRTVCLLQHHPHRTVLFLRCAGVSGESWCQLWVDGGGQLSPDPSLNECGDGYGGGWDHTVGGSGTLPIVGINHSAGVPGECFSRDKPRGPAPRETNLGPPTGWKTCGGLPDAYNHTACPSQSTCCQQNWQETDGKWGCIDEVGAVCCGGYTACPAGRTCVGSGAMVPTNCTAPSTPPVLGKQVCKTGPLTAPSSSNKTVLVIGDSVSIGYFPYLAAALEGSEGVVALHSPDGGDGGAEETAYGWQCLEYFLRSPDGTQLRPDVLMFNWGLHNRFPDNATVVPGQHGTVSQYAGPLEQIVERLVAWAAERSPPTKLLFAITTP